MQLGLLTSSALQRDRADPAALGRAAAAARAAARVRYARALLLGLAFSCNLGGMLTPIASPQNAVALEALSRVGAEVGFAPG